MTLQQLRLASEIASCGSISAAALKLHLSQPNASQSIKTLEKELGYAVFARDGGKAVPTEQGYLFLEHADIILREDAAIHVINGYTGISRLRVGSMHYTPAVDAYIRFAEEHQDNPYCDLTCVNISAEKGTELLRERELDIIVSLQIKTTLPMLQKLCKEYHLSLTKHMQIPVCVRVRKDHPLVLNGKLDGSMKSFQLLNEYPYANYRNMDHLLPMLQPTGAAPFGCSYMIYTDERDTRLKIVQHSNAYSIGTLLPDRKLEAYGLKAFPIGDERALLCSCVRKGEDNLPSISRYRELLTEEIVWAKN